MDSNVSSPQRVVCPQLWAGGTLTSVEAGVGDEAAAQRARRVGGPVLGQPAETRLAEDVSAGQTAVGAEEDVQTDGAGQAVSVHVPRVRRTVAAAFSLGQEKV